MRYTLRNMVVGLAVLCFVAAGSARANIIIDDFEVPAQQTIVRDDTGTTAGTENASDESPNIIGGFRDVSLEVTSDDGTQETTVTYPDAGEFSVDNAGNQQSIVTITYDGSGTPGTGFGPEDLSSLPFLSVQIASAANQSNLDILLTDTSGNFDSQDQNFDAFDIGDSVQFAMSGFTQGAGSPGVVDLTTIDEIVVTLTANQAGADARFDFIQVTPEPTAVVLLGLVALVGLVRRPGRDG